eukprot:1156748-Pelagomonas_calceolata.AAC.14
MGKRRVLSFLPCTANTEVHVPDNMAFDALPKYKKNSEVHPCCDYSVKDTRVPALHKEALVLLSTSLQQET